MKHIVNDVRIKEIKELSPPGHVLREFPATETAAITAYAARAAIHRILHGADSRLLVVVGPCSIHDFDSALEYARRLKDVHDRLGDDLLILMRVYFEKPRTTVGWKGLINDPRMDGSYKINEGLRLARRLLWELAEMGLPCATEFLDTISPQYTADLISWGAIGARTTESQVHRELASGLSCPVGFKNGTDGNIKIAVDAIRAAQAPHHFLSVTKAGHSAIVSTNGNEDCHVILRGGKQTELRSREHRRGLHRARQVRSRGARDGRFLAWQQPQGLQEADGSGDRCSRPARRRRGAHLRRDDRVAPQRGASGPETRQAACLRCFDHRCLPRLGRQRRRARPTGRSGPAAAGCSRHALISALRSFSGRLLLVAAGLTLAFRLWLAAVAPITGDEAYFIAWGRHPDWGFYDHPPLIGWWLAALLAAGDAEWWLRLPQVLQPLLLALTVRWAWPHLWPDQRDYRDWVALLVLLAPLNIWNVFVTTDTALIYCAVLSGLAWLRATQDDSPRWYLVAGIFLAGAVLSKYFAALLGFAYLIDALNRRSQGLSPDSPSPMRVACRRWSDGMVEQRTLLDELLV